MPPSIAPCAMSINLLLWNEIRPAGPKELIWHPHMPVADCTIYNTRLWCLEDKWDDMTMAHLESFRFRNKHHPILASLFVLEHKVIRSSLVTLSIVSAVPGSLVIIVYGRPYGNRVSIISSGKIGQPSLGRLRAPIFLHINLYAVLNGSMFAYWHIR